MRNIRLSESEYRLMDVIWANEPMLATELVSICREKYEWKKQTVYTMLRRMGEKDLLLFENKKVVSKEQRDFVNKSEGEELLHRAYGDSLPDFFAAFLQDRKFSKEEAEMLRKMIKEAEE